MQFDFKNSILIILFNTFETRLQMPAGHRSAFICLPCQLAVLGLNLRISGADLRWIIRELGAEELLHTAHQWIGGAALLCSLVYGIRQLVGDRRRFPRAEFRERKYQD